MGRKRSFTLLELIVVIIIIAILGAFGLTQYTKVIEKGRAAEAKASLGTLRTLELAYNQENGVYTAGVNTTAGLDSGLPQGSCNANYYFSYTCDAATGLCTATRCTAGGKAPNFTGAAYTVALSVNGTWTNAGGY